MSGFVTVESDRKYPSDPFVETKQRESFEHVDSRGTTPPLLPLHRRDTMSHTDSGTRQPVAETGLWYYGAAIVRWFCQGLGNLVSWVPFILSKIGLWKSQPDVVVIPFPQRCEQVRKDMAVAETPLAQMRILVKVACEWRDSQVERGKLFNELVGMLRPSEASDRPTHLEQALAQSLKAHVLTRDEVGTILRDLGNHLFANALDRNARVPNILIGVLERFARYTVEDQVNPALESSDPVRQLYGLRLLRSVKPLAGLEDDEADAKWITLQFLGAFDGLAAETLRPLLRAFTVEVMTWGRWNELVDARIIATRQQMGTSDRFTGVTGFEELDTADEHAFGEFLATLADESPEVLNPIRHAFYNSSVELQEVVTTQMKEWIAETERSDEQVYDLLERANFIIPSEARSVATKLIAECELGIPRTEAIQTAVVTLMRYTELGEQFFDAFRDAEQARAYDAMKGGIPKALEAKAETIRLAVEDRRPDEVDVEFDEVAVRLEETDRARQAIIDGMKQEIQETFAHKWDKPIGTVIGLLRDDVAVKHPEYLVGPARECLQTR